MVTRACPRQRRDEPGARGVTWHAGGLRLARHGRATPSSRPPHTSRPARLPPLLSAPHARPTRTARVPRAARFLLPLALCAAPLALACADADGERRSSNGDVARVDSQPPVIPPAREPYRETTVASGGSVTGTVTFTGDLPEPPSPPEAAGCARRPRAAARRTGDRLGGAVVWLADVRTGKPLGLERRYNVTIAGCDYQPRVQTAIAGGTLNLLSDESIEHSTRLVRQSTREVTDVVPQFMQGQVVPVREALSRTGMVEISCARHPWARAWLAVFDHPYHTMSDANGAFTIDGVPPGQYTLMAWHEAFGRVEQRVTVAPDQAGRVEVRFGG